MQTPAKAPRASKPKAPAIPALMPNPVHTEIPTGIRWAIHALNDDACVQALEELQTLLYRQPQSSALHTKEIALIEAQMNAKLERRRSFENCAYFGGLLYAWRGSRALLQTLPSSLRGAQ